MAQKDVLVGFVVISGASPKCWESVFIGMPNAECRLSSSFHSALPSQGGSAFLGPRAVKPGC